MGLAAAAMVGSTIMGAVGASRQGRAERKAANARAKQNEKNADLAIEQAAEDRKRFTTQARMAEGENLASLGKSGITSQGSASDILAQNAVNAERDAAAITHQGQIRAESLRAGASAERAAGRSAERGGNLSAVGGLLGGIARASRFSSPTPVKKGP